MSVLASYVLRFTLRNFTVGFVSCIVIGILPEYRELLIVYRAYTIILSLLFLHKSKCMCMGIQIGVEGLTCASSIHMLNTCVIHNVQTSSIFTHMNSL